jgi:hypothetical protein
MNKYHAMINCKTLLATDLQNVNEIPTDVDILFFEDHIGNDDSSDDAWAKLNQFVNQDTSTIFIIEYFFSDDLINNAKTLCLPFQAYHTSLAMSKLLPKQSWAEKTTAFNFSINKLRYNRSWLLQELEKFKLTTESYSVYQSTVASFPDQFWLADTCETRPGYVNNNDLKNIEIYHHYLKSKVYEPSFISLITEPGWNDHSTTLTEKTLFAFDSGTVPIWIGGYRQAQQLKNLGFDVFDDIVDHSYQFLNDPVARMQQAIKSNLDLLKNPAQLKNFFVANQTRFCHNQDHARSGNWFYTQLNRELARVSLTVPQLSELYRRLVIEHNCQWPGIKSNLK